MSPLVGVPTDSSVYVLSSLKDTTNYYIGLASKTLNRLVKHKDFIMGNSPSESVHKQLLSLYDISQIYWSLIYDSQNYEKLALATYAKSYISA
jgi:hypothetical protein